MWDWRYPIDELRSDIRESRSRGETSTTLDNLETRVDEIESMFERLEKDDIEKLFGRELEDFYAFRYLCKERVELVVFLDPSTGEIATLRQ